MTMSSGPSLPSDRSPAQPHIVLIIAGALLLLPPHKISSVLRFKNLISQLVLMALRSQHKGAVYIHHQLVAALSLHQVAAHSLIRKMAPHILLHLFLVCSRIKPTVVGINILAGHPRNSSQ